MNNTADKGITCTVWLHMLREGGRWKVGELAQEVDRDQTELRGLLRSMNNSGHVARFEKDGEAKWVQYGITAACKVPVGVTLAEMASAGGIRLETE